MNLNVKSSTPKAWELILKPAIQAYNLNNKVNKLLDYYEESSDDRKCEQAYSRALNLQKRSNKLLGITSR